MKSKGILSLLAALMFGACATIVSPKSEIGLMSYNIRCEPCEKPESLNHWSKRRDLVVQTIKGQNPDFLGLQEASLNQTTELAQSLPQYGYYGIGREVGEMGERNALFFNKSRFLPISQKTLWLNEKGAKFELGWDAAWVRTATIMVFKDKAKGKKLAVINTHLDNEGETARKEAANIIEKEILELGNMPIILMGDFNDLPQSEPHLILDRHLNDTVNYGPEDFTFNGFGTKMDKGFVIDYIMASDHFTSNKGGIIYKLLNNQFPSDHFAIFSKVQYVD